jgi:hypothetical protein
VTDAWVRNDDHDDGRGASQVKLGKDTVLVITMMMRLYVDRPDGRVAAIDIIDISCTHSSKHRIARALTRAAARHGIQSTCGSFSSLAHLGLTGLRMTSRWLPVLA